MVEAPPVVARYRARASRLQLRADVGFANPEAYEYLESERIKYADLSAGEPYPAREDVLSADAAGWTDAERGEALLRQFRISSRKSSEAAPRGRGYVLTMQDLKEKTIRGGAARLGAQVASLALRMGALVVLARLLGPKDFGLVGMVTAFTGVLSMFRDFGLSAAAVQRSDVTRDQHSTLFWLNLLLGALLALVTLAAAPAIAAFYHEPRLVWVAAALGTAFLFNAMGIQHSALLQRQMRFTALAAISVVSLTVGTAIAIGGAAIGYGYWALVANSVTTPLVATIGFWLATGWVPGMPRRRAGIRSMMHFGGTLTLNDIIAYIALNADKVMIGRFLGVDAIGIYGRGFQLVNYSDRQSEFGGWRGGVLRALPPAERSCSPQKLLSEGLLVRPRADLADHDRLRTVCRRLRARPVGAEVAGLDRDRPPASADDCGDGRH